MIVPLPFTKRFPDDSPLSPPRERVRVRGFFERRIFTNSYLT